MIHRICNPLLSNSFFLFGPRGSGKTTFLREFFHSQAVLWVDLLREEEVISLSRNPQELEERIRALDSPPEWVVIDEIQKIPSLLDQVHRLIESPSPKAKIKFALTGSSARKLKRGAANLLAGRAFMNHFHPLTSIELGEAFSLPDVLHWGSLPKIFDFQNEIEKREYLRSYTSTYLKEEIKEEQLVRRVDPFRRFLEIAAQSNSQILNYSKIARDSGANPKSVERYFEILEDTLIGFFLDPYHPSVRKRQTQKPKFYFFDLGVKKALELSLDTPVQPRTYAYGKAFEHLIILEFIRLNDYYRKDFRFSYFRTKDDLEIDLVIERPGKKLALIEIKSATHVENKEINKLNKIAKDFPQETELFIFCQEPHSRMSGEVVVIPWREGFQRVFQ